MHRTILRFGLRMASRFLFSIAVVTAAYSVSEALNIGIVTEALVEGNRSFFRFGSGDATHVSNAYHLPIFASVKTDVAIPTQHVVIPPGEYFKFVTDHSKSDTAYVTVIAVDEGGNEVHTFINVPKRADYSVMMNSEGFLVDVKYGSIWQRA